MQWKKCRFRMNFVDKNFLSALRMPFSTTSATIVRTLKLQDIVRYKILDPRISDFWKKLWKIFDFNGISNVHKQTCWMSSSFHGLKILIVFEKNLLGVEFLDIWKKIRAETSRKFGKFSIFETKFLNYGYDKHTNVQLAKRQRRYSWRRPVPPGKLRLI